MLAVILALFVLLSFSCAPAVDPDEPDPDENDVDVEPDPDPVEEPGEPQRVVVAQAQGVGSWDPPQDWLTAPEWLIQNAYDSIMVRSGDGSEFLPELAREWEHIDDYTFRLYLQEGVRFHDGTELTAEDVKFHWERVREGTRELYIVAGQYDWYEDIVIHDDYTLDFITEEPSSIILFHFRATGSGIVSKAYVEEVGPEGVHSSPMGSGPWKLKDWVRDEHVLFEANEDYWGGRPDFDELEFRIIPEASTRVAELLTEGVDIIYDIHPEDEQRVDAEDHLTTKYVNIDRGLFMHPRFGPHPNYPDDPELTREFTTEDPRVREAIEKALDKYALRDIAGGEGEAYRMRMFEPLPEANPALFGPEACLYDPERARELLSEAGYGPGECKVVIHAPEDAPHGDVAQVVRAMLEEVGFDVDLRLMDGSTFRSEIQAPRKAQELYFHAAGGNMDPRMAVAQFVPGSDSMIRYAQDNLEAWADPSKYQRLDELIDVAFTEVHDDDARLRAYHEIGQIVADERLYIGLFQQSTLWGINTRLDYEPRFDNHIRGMDIRLAQ